jgi:Nucleotidyl transferase AbiEii toxin, Type IV TA system
LKTVAGSFTPTSKRKKSRIVVPDMLETFEARLDILPESQRRLWPELDAVPSDFVLYGGTALALQLGHRVSEDFDFFSSSGFAPDLLRAGLPFFRDLDVSDSNVWVHRKTDNLEAFVDRGGMVKVAFFGGLNNLRRVRDPRRAVGSRVRVASLIDLAGMKMRVIQARGSWKDYVDIHTLASHGIGVEAGLAAARAIDRNFDPAISIRALQFFGDGTLSRVPAKIQSDLIGWAQAVNLGKLPAFHPTPGLCPGGPEQ